ncbi:MAG TPA: GIY-YIG nuclease family protein [Candidatus Eremiobacteraceae bacterium]|nr:GIY-YIG nuclease family protein [Candidatus Eremiobacteraceae bacterium]
MWHYVYLASTADGVFYCGYAIDPVTRVAAHNAGRGAKILRGKRPVKLAYVRRFRSRGNALRFEHALKARTHEYKKELSRRWLALTRFEVKGTP